MKRIFIISLLLSLIIGLQAQERVVLSTGTIGEENNITWTRYQDGELVFEGVGEIPEQEAWSNTRPWDDNVLEEDEYPIRTITIGEGITSIGANTFFLHYSITAINLANSIEIIGGAAFFGTSISSVTFPASIKRIEYQAFRRTYISGDIILPEGLEYFALSAFSPDFLERNYAQISSLYIPSSVTEIGTDGWDGQDPITITIAADNPVYDTRDNCNAIIRTEDNCLLRAFVNSTIPVSVTSIGECAFRWSYWLTSIDLSATNITSISSGAFMYCPNIQEMRFPEPLSTLNWLGDFKRIYIGSNMTDMESLFTDVESGDIDLTELTDMYISAKNPPLLRETCFRATGARRTVILHVQPGCVNAYRNAFGWSNFVNIVGDYIIPENNEEHYDLYDTQNYTNNSTITVDELTYTRTFNNNKWQALYVPFAMDFEDWDAAGLEVARITNFHQYDRDGDGEADTQECEIIKQTAGCSTVPSYPYFVRAKEVGEKTITVQNATLFAAEDLSIDCSSVDWMYIFTGNYSSRAMGPGAYEDYTHEFALSEGILQYAEQPVTLNPYRWSLRIHSRMGNSTVPQRVQLRVIGPVADEGLETSLIDEQIGSESANMYSGEVYTIDGSLVKKIQGLVSIHELGLSSGLYLIGGQKVFIP